MRRIILTGLFVAAMATPQSCERSPAETWDNGPEGMTIYYYLVENEANFSSFLKILEAGRIAKTLSAYNPKGSGYTLFLPTNEAINTFIDNSNAYSSLNDVLSASQFVFEFARYHVVPEYIPTDNFPFGALQENNLSGDRLMVNFIIGSDSSYYKINNYATIIKRDIKLSNGCIHVIGEALAPITYTNYDWLGQNPDLSIFRSLIYTTGLDAVIDVKTEDNWGYYYQSTLLVEPDSIYHKNNVFSLEDLIAVISPDNEDYTNEYNRLYYYAAYHILEGAWSLNDFVINPPDQYATYIGAPIFIDGYGKEIKINPGQEIYSIVIDQGDTNIIDYVEFLYDGCNVATRNGVVHFVNQLLNTQLPPGIPPGLPPRPSWFFQFFEEPLLFEYSKREAEYLIEDTTWLNVITWSGTDLYYIKSNYEECQAWNEDFLLMNGDFYISYSLRAIEPGKYSVYLGAEAYSEDNAMVRVYLDGTNIGDVIDLKSGGSEWDPFIQIELGEINFLNYEDHTIEIESSAPGRFLWDYILFEPK